MFQKLIAGALAALTLVLLPVPLLPQPTEAATLINGPVFDVKVYGAQGDGNTNDTTAINAAITACNAAGGGTVLVPAGTFAHSGVITLLSNVTLAGVGDTSVLLATDSVNTAITATSTSNIGIRDLKSSSAAVVRQSAATAHAITLVTCTNVRVDRVTVVGSAAAGIYSSACTDVQIRGCFVSNTMADGITTINGTQRATITGNHCYNTGDDAISVVSYRDVAGVQVNTSPVTDVVISDNVVQFPRTRGITVVGGRRITVAGNVIRDTTLAGLYLTEEFTGTSSGQYKTFGCTQVTASHNQLFNTNQAPAAFTSSTTYPVYSWVSNAGKYYLCSGVGGGTATVAPTHTSGVVTGADGYAWTFRGTFTTQQSILCSVTASDQPSSRILIQGNQVETCGYRGIEATQYVSDLTVVDNIIRDVGSEGMQIGCQNAVILNNRISDVNSYGIAMTANSAGSYVVNGNYISNVNRSQFSFVDAINLLSGSSIKRIEICDNSLIGDPNNSAPWLTATAYTTGTYVRNGSPGYVYVCTTAGGGNTSVAPTHTSGTVTGGDGYAWQYVSCLYERSVEVSSSYAGELLMGRNTFDKENFLAGGSSTVLVDVTYRRRGMATAAPSTGTGTVGDVVWNSTPTATSAIGWICTTSGSPGTWTAMQYGLTGTANTWTGSQTINGNLVLGTAGNGLQITGGSNARIGSSTLVAGTITVANTSVTANTKLFLSRSTAGGTTGTLSYTVNAGVGFTITSSSNSDTSTLDWLLIEKL